MKKLVGPVLALALGGALLTLGVGQEVPIGGLSGQVTMKENGRPLAHALVTVSLKGVPDDERPQVRGAETDEKGSYSFRNLPAGDYSLSVSSKEHTLDPMRITIEEGKAKTVRVAAKPNEPYLNLYASQKVFTPGETPKVELHGFAPEREVRLQVRRLDADEIAKSGGYERAIGPLASLDDIYSLEGKGTKVSDVKEVVKARDAEGAFVQTLPVGSLTEGAYLVDCRAGGLHADTVLLVSRLALVSKTGRDGHTTAFTTDLSSGQPVPDVGVTAVVGNEVRSLGRTGGDGVGEFELPAQTGETIQPVVLMARHGDSVALVMTSPERPANEKAWIYAYPERPAYRPGDTVNFKGFVRQVDKDGYRLPGNGTVAVTVKDPDGHPLQKLSLPLSVHGSFHGSFDTSRESKPGGYAIECEAFGASTNYASANVVAYRKPEFSISVSPVKDHYAMGDRAAATVECKYYYGGPVVGAKVKASIYRSPVFSYEDENGETSEGESYGGGEYSDEVEAVTDASGRATIEFDTRGESDPDTITNDYDYTVSASVTEDGGKYFDGEGKVRVTRGDLGMTMEVQNPILVPGDVAQVAVKTTSATDSKKPVGGRSVTVEAGVEAYGDGASTFVRRESYTVTTAADGTAVLRVPVERAESLTFRAHTQDDAGRPVVAEAWAYVQGSPAQADAQRGELKITLDKRGYKEGDTAKVLLQTDLPGGTALLCLQTDRVLWRKTVRLDTATTVVPVPVSKEFAPNVYVSAAYVREKHFLQADRRLRVERVDRTLNVQVKPLKAVYLPGQTARVTVRTTDAAGNPVPAEVSLATVDRGIYDVAADETDLYKELYPERSNGVETNYSFPEIYLDGGDKGVSKVPLRTEFRDTAAWSPAIWTGDSGEATVDVPLPDNLTEWRVTAIGLSDASQAGMATASFQARKPLMVRLGLPQFLVEGDRQRLTATIANDTGTDADVALDVQAEGLRLANDVPKSVHVTTGKPQTIDLDVEALGAGTASLSVRALAGANSDGVRQTFPVLAHGRPVLETRVAEGDADLHIRMPEEVDPHLGNLKVTVSPTLAGDLTQALPGLIDYPYGCVEQTMSRFMPAVLVEQTVRGLGLPKPKRLERLPTIVRDSLARLAKMRHGDGGWGWWDYDTSEPFMTALVLDGLDRAKRAGYDVSPAGPEEAVNWGMEYLKDAKRSKDASLRDRLYLTYALLRWGQADAASFLKGADLRDRVTREYGQTERHPTATELATAALAYGAAGRKTDALLDRMLAKARVGEETVDWGSEDDAWGEEPASLALVALEAGRPNSPLIPRIVRGILKARQGDGWSSTRDTAYALVGLTEYLRRTKELTAEPAQVYVRINGEEQDALLLDPRSDDPTKTIEIPRSKLRGGDEVRVEIEANGSRCYTTVALSAFERAPELKAKATDKGLTVTRQTFLMEPRRAADGSLRLLPSAQPVTRFQNGDVVRVELTIHSDVPRPFVLVEEPTPSACHVTERTELEESEEKDWWWSRTVVMDDHLAFFARNLPQGESKIVYHMRAEAAGQASALPARAANMYDPGRWASTAETRVEVAR